MIGVINFGYIFALSQFFVSWGIALYYAHVANKDFDRLTRELVDELQIKEAQRMKKLFAAVTLALSLATVAYADEPAKAPEASGRAAQSEHRRPRHRAHPLPSTRLPPCSRLPLRLLRPLR